MKGFKFLTGLFMLFAFCLAMTVPQSSLPPSYGGPGYDIVAMIPNNEISTPLPVQNVAPLWYQVVNLNYVSSPGLIASITRFNPIYNQLCAYICTTITQDEITIPEARWLPLFEAVSCT
jgi:hypothetical protein